MLPLSKLRKDPIIVLGGMIVALTIMIGAGFAFLYFKSELDVKQMSNEIGIIREMLMQKARLEWKRSTSDAEGTDRISENASDAITEIILRDQQKGMDRISEEASDEITEIIRRDQANRQ